MKISVITVCFNAARTIGHTLASYFRQDHLDKELVIVDGASRDDTMKIIATFPTDDVRVISEPDRGIYDAMNKGLALFTGEAVGFLNADDRYKDGFALSRIASKLALADIVFGNLDFISDRGGTIVRRWRGGPYKRDAFKQGWMPAHPTFYVRRHVAEKVGQFDISYRTAADYDFMLRALELEDFKSAHIDDVLVEMLQGGASTAGLRAYWDHNLEALRARQKWLGAGPLDYALFAKPLRKVSQFLVDRGAA